MFAKERFVDVSLVLHRPAWCKFREEGEDEEAAARRRRKVELAKKKQRKKEAAAHAAAGSGGTGDGKGGEEDAAAAADAAEEAQAPVDVACILRGGYPKAKFSAEPADAGKQALTKLEQAELDLDFAVVPLKIPEAFLKSVTEETEWTVLGGKHGARAKMTQMAKLMRRKDHELEELESLLNSATGSIQQFHLQQKQLFDEFVTLRSKYDDTKAKLRDAIWGHACNMSREFSVIPPVMRDPLEDSNTIEQYALGSVIGSGESSQVRSCKLSTDMGGGGRRGGGGTGGKQSSSLSVGITKSSMAKRDLAIKIINKSRVQDIASLQRIANEVRVLREANNVNVMALYDVLHTDRRLYMVMERGDRDLFTVIMDANRASKQRGGHLTNPGGRVDEELTRDVMQQILSGLSYIHGMHVCHRDLKPENIVLVEKPGTPKPVAKIIDFGSCAATAGGANLLDLCGTPGFLPPEMIMEDSYDGFLGDVWSVGAIALEMVLGHELFAEVWLPAYSEELVGSRKDFAMKVRHPYTIVLASPPASYSCARLTPHAHTTATPNRWPRLSRRCGRQCSNA